MHTNDLLSYTYVHGNTFFFICIDYVLTCEYICIRLLSSFLYMCTRYTLFFYLHYYNGWLFCSWLLIRSLTLIHGDATVGKGAFLHLLLLFFVSSPTPSPSPSPPPSLSPSALPAFFLVSSLSLSTNLHLALLFILPSSPFPFLKFLHPYPHLPYLCAFHLCCFAGLWD